MNNGGFAQYLENGSGALAEHAVAAMQAVGAELMSQVAAAALRVAGAAAQSAEDDVRAAAVAAWTPEVRDALEQLDRAFCGSPRT